MFASHFLFELKLRLRSLSTYVYFLIFFLLTFFETSVHDFGPIGTGKVLLNGPYALTLCYVQLTGFGAILIAAIFGPSILRDFQQDTYQLLFTKPISKFDYLGGRWAASLVVTIFVLSGLIWGAMAGIFMPWADKTRLAPITLATYFQPFLYVIAQVFILGSLFFCVAALTRRLVVVYLQGVVLFAIYLILFAVVISTNQLDRTWPSFVDPLGFALLDNVTRYWTVAERNLQLIHWSGLFLYNRLTWLGVGLITLFVTYVFFPMSAETLTSQRSGRRARAAKEEEEAHEAARPRFAISLPRVTQTFSAATRRAQLLSLTRVRFFNVVREIPFWAIGLVMVANTVVNCYFAGQVNDVDVWPVTYLMVGMVEGSAALFFYIIATLYAGELVWRERNVHFEQIHDSLPVPDWMDWLSKFLALAVVQFILITLVMVCGIIMQTASGYYHYELLQYVKELYILFYPQMLTFILLALFIHTILGNKFLGHAVVIGFLILIPILYRYGIENRLVLYGEITPYTYSDMNGYGHFVQGLVWSISYWFFVGVLLAVFAIVLARRGADVSWPARLRVAGPRFRTLVPVAALALLLAAGCGAWFYYNTHILNEFRTDQENRHRLADYERLYKKYERLPQPKITAVDVTVDIFPERRSFTGSGHYMLVNHTAQPISEIHISDGRESVDEVRFDRTAHVKLSDKRHFYTIYALDQPLEPGGNMRVDFRASYTARGFKDGHERPEFAYNGTFFDRDYFPYIGYNQGLELDDPVRRREEKLGPLEEMAPPGDPYYSNISLFTADSEWVTFHTVVSTSPDQIAIAPGYLQREWTQNGRRYFEYSMGDTRINNFFSFLSGRFNVRRDQWKGVNLEIYYQPGDEFNLDRMMESIKSGLDYYQASYGPYQFQQFRVLEFPRYRGFAQSFPNTVPYSESIGFIERMKKPDDIDLLYFVTAHELAHQWWGHQLIGSDTQGSNMMSETLAEYSALKVLARRYGPDMLHKELRHELDTYLRGRGGETRHEPPLVLVQREPYVWYQKGALVMFALDDYIGEDRMNAALRSFLEKNRYASGPFPDTRGFVAALREVTPPDLQYVITDMFESIVLFDNKAVSATYAPTPDHKYKVTLTVSAQKRKADGSGNESPMTLDDRIDVGVFSGTKEHLRPLEFAKHQLTEHDNTFTFVVDQPPTWAGIDPYNKLIDRNPEDNLIAVERK
ncbi:MAG TPA: M1 family aminopeptidase [Terriglobia bacterium]|nr:M1 family aminopeptidase [Terriglobia bacterium]